MFQINPYPVNYDHLLRELQAVQVAQFRLDELRAIFDTPGGRRRAKRVACSWLRCDRPATAKTRPVRHYLREWAQDHDAPKKKRQRRAQNDGDPELKPGKASKNKPISASKDSPVFAATAAQIADISRLWQTGATLKVIGEHVGMSYQAVSRIIRALGMTRPEKPRLRAARASDAQIADVLRQRSDGVSYNLIAAATGLTYPQVARIARQTAQQAAQ
ncbi:MAG: hypothetical protein E6R03_08685 [Hyphomicrobiaceae bacterium]|nr:MAG: hypothetical protein E6R03_08685 [Hyphomicrobiaceae bacterium]